MKILYGALASGGGHLSRLEQIAPLLRAGGAKVTCLISGHPPGQHLETKSFGDTICRRGLRYVAPEGQLKFLPTIFNNNAFVFAREAATLDLAPYDLVLTDMEPVTAWAAQIQRKPVIGIAHHYAFQRDIPQAPGWLRTGRVSRTVAPASLSIGLHFHHFGQAGILPPIVPDLKTMPAQKNKILVYMHTEGVERVKAALKPHTKYTFYIYDPAISEFAIEDNLIMNPKSRAGFLADLQDCDGVITNAGFMLPAEAVHAGKKVLVRPLEGKSEQMSNAIALDTLGLATVMTTLNQEVIASWLSTKQSFSIKYPEVAQGFADWVLSGDWKNPDAFIADLWARTKIEGNMRAVPHFH